MVLEHSNSPATKMSSPSTFFVCLSLLLLFSTEAQARGFPGMSFNYESMVLNIGGGRISSPSPPSLTTSSIFEMMCDIIRWIMSSSAPTPTGQQQVVDQTDCCNKLIMSSQLFSPPQPPTPPHQSAIPPPAPCIPCPPHGLRVHPSPAKPSTPSSHAYPSPVIPPTPSSHANPSPVIPPTPSSHANPSPVKPPTPISHASPVKPSPRHPPSPHQKVHPPPIMPSSPSLLSSPIIPPPIVSEMMINGISRNTPSQSVITHPQTDHLQAS